MKKIKIALYMFAIAGLFASCSDSLDIEQPGQVSPEATYVDYSSVLKNFYGVFSTVSISNQIAFNSIWTDENAIGIANGGQGISDGMYSYVLTASNDYASGIWYSNYIAINNINRFIIGAEALLSQNLSTAEEANKIKELLAQARALRAFCYHELMTYFVTDYKDNSGLGVLLFDNIPVFDSPKLARSSVGEVYNFIESDLDYALANLNATIGTSIVGTQTPQYFVQKQFVYALRSRMNLYRGNYQAAIDNANLALAVVPVVARASYSTIWNDTTAGDVIFKLSRISGNATIGSTWASVNSNARSGSQFFEVGRSLFNLSEEFGTGSDIRQNVITSTTSVISPNYQQALDYRTEDILSVGKYARSKNINLLADLKTFRASEMVLIKAEAFTMLGQTTDAQTALNSLRSVRISGSGVGRIFTGNMASDLKFILTERRLELALEGFRWVDIKRLGKLANVTFERDPLDCGYNGSCTPPDPTSYKFTLPIPSAEIGANPLVQQNPGY